MYSSQIIAERIKYVAHSKGITIGTMLDKISLGKNTMTNFKTSMPKADNLAKIADYLGVSVDYLLGRTDNPNINRGSSIIAGNNNSFSPIIAGGSINNNSTVQADKQEDGMIQQFMELFKGLTLEKQIEVMSFALQAQK